MDDFIYFDYNQKSSVLLIFFFNALLFSILLLKKGIQERRNDSKILALFIFLCGLYICPFLLGYGGWYSKRAYREFLFFMPFQQLFLIGPVLYFYVQSLLNFEYKFSKKDVIHLLPALAYGGYSVLVWIVDRWILNEFYFYADGQDKDLDFWYQMAGLISMLLYLGLSLRYYKKYRVFTLQEASFADEISYRWIEHFLFAFSFILLLRVVFFMVNPEWGEFGSKYWYYVCFSILFLYIAVTGYSTVVKTTLPFS
ncbi:MAG: AraC family transcriptional regulator, partial [Marinirhabdus sp.]|nr:AraC family transcriptional regulator [Marinirhabdus sp.]